MIISNNLTAQIAQRNYKLNTDNKAKSTKKLSSGYRINMAADDAAGLTISEKLREQIRGLDRGTENAKDGISWIQTGDGALGEVQDILHRMKEITVQALNDTNSESDKAALQMEFDNLQSEIDRITGTTQFNTKNIFSEHEPDYYQMEGNVKWQQSQKHTVNIPDNSLTVTYLQEPGGAEKTVTIEIPEGVYTTQELMDEFDDAIRALGANDDGINLEYTKDGTCNLNLEGGEEITGISGGLKYLINDAYDGGSVGALIGTTYFASEDGCIDIVPGQNDNLSFQILDFNGNVIGTKDITLNPGPQTRQEFIDYLNGELAGTGVEAVKYSTGIKLQSDSAIITGFKGNMFKIDTDKNNIYSSIFYDNVMYGRTTTTAAKFTGGAILTTNSQDDKYNNFVIDYTNNQLKIAANGGTSVTLTIPNGNYDASSMRNKLNELFTANGLDLTADFYTSSNFNGLTITSNVKGLSSNIDIDPDSSAYYTLFRKCDYTVYGAKATLTNETRNDDAPTLTGGKTFSADKLPLNVTAGVNDKFKLSLNGTDYEITIAAKNYTSTTELVNELNDKLNGASALSGYKDKVVASASNNNIVLSGKSGSGITNINVLKAAGNTGYEDIFVGEKIEKKVVTASGNGTATTPAKITTNTDVLEPATINSSNNKLTVNINGTNRTVTLPTGNLTHDQIANEINNQLKEQTTISNNTFNNINVKGKTTDVMVSASGYGNTTVASKTYLAKGESVKKQGTTEYGTNNPAKLVTDIEIKNPTVINSENNKLQISLNTDSTDTNANGKTEVITLDSKSYTPAELVSELQKKVNLAFGTGEGGVDVSLTNGKLTFTSRVGNKVPGNQTSIKFDTNSSFIKQYKTTNTNAVAKTSRNLASSITLDGTNNGFSFAYTDPVNGTTNVNLDLSSGTYTPATLVDEINNKLNKASVPVKASLSDGKLQLTTNGAGNGYKLQYSTGSGGTSAKTLFGELEDKSTVSATADNIIQSSITIDDSSNEFNIRVDGVDYSLTLDNGTYDRDGFKNMLNNKLTAAGAPLTVSLTNNQLTYTDKNKGKDASIYMTYGSGGSSMKAIYGQTKTVIPGAKAEFNGDKLSLTGLSNNGSLKVDSSINGSIFETADTISTPISPTTKAGYISSKYATLDGVNLTEPINIDKWNSDLKFTYSKNGANKIANIKLTEKSYTYDELVTELQGKIDTAIGAGELTVTADATGVTIKANNPGSLYKLSSFSGGFYDKVLSNSSEVSIIKLTKNVDGTQKVERAFTIGRKDIKNGKVEIEKGINDEFIFDITYGGTTKTISTKLDEGVYNGTSLVAELQKKIDASLVNNGLSAGMIEAGIGGVNTGVVGANDDNALCLKLSDSIELPYEGEYVIDGVRGNAAFYVFYQSDGEMVPAYVKGSKKLDSDTVIDSSNNELSFDVDGTSYSINIDEGTYSGTGLIDELNNKFQAGGIPAKAKMDGNTLKLSYEKLGKHSIDNIGGSAKNAVFYNTNKGDGKLKDINLQLSGNAGDKNGNVDARGVAAGRDYMVIDRPILNTVSLGINSLTISQNKYADKALGRIDEALDQVSSVRSQFGALQNRLEHAIAGNDNNSENTSSAESRLRDTEMASEMVAFSKHNILQEASQAMIAQANSLQEGVLRLLQ